MDVEYTGRQTTVTRRLKTQAESGLARVAKIVGDRGAAHVVLTTEKYRHTAELTIRTRLHKMVAVSECKVVEGMELALREALVKVEQQAIRYKKKRSSIKRHAQTAARQAGATALEEGEVPSLVKASVPIKVPAKNGRARKNAEAAPAPEPSLVRSKNGAARTPMSLEEAMKEAALRDRDVFVFRDHAGSAMVLHRLRDGKIELIEVP